jgi:beta-carotene 3-hydroxylase
MPDSLLPAVVFFAALFGMEGVAWCTHRWIMHGPLWCLHRSHHEPRAGRFERNDLFALLFASLAIALFWNGMHPGWPGQVSWWAGAGVTAYGALYALVHDGLVHRRWPMPRVARRGYLRRLVQAHHLHHAVQGRDGAVSFGFLLPADARRLARRLRARRLATGPAVAGRPANPA